MKWRHRLPYRRKGHNVCQCSALRLLRQAPGYSLCCYCLAVGDGAADPPIFCRPRPPLANLLNQGISSVLLLHHVLLQQFCLHQPWPKRHVADPVPPQLPGTVSSQPVALQRDRRPGGSQGTWSRHLPPLPSPLPPRMPQPPGLPRSPVSAVHLPQCTA